MQYLRDVLEMSCGTMAIMQMRLQQDSSKQDSSNHRGRRQAPFFSSLPFWSGHSPEPIMYPSYSYQKTELCYASSLYPRHL